ncbi:putative quinol monooxygenase [Rhodococcus sp. NPDC057014]|uniref:putative quinol monooxygenase n=1 Tax=Rhodococcus sp. NPDC057014 TaxID=3346000 RepID=UPI00362AECAE
MIAILELTFKPETVETAQKVMARVLKETREFDGCIRVDNVLDAKNPNTWRVIETWESMDHDAAYRRFRAGEGAITDLGSLLAGPPSLSKGTLDASI